jgi:DNA-binding LacI/PurR family transcriptional regulator
VEVLYGDYSIESGRSLTEDCVKRRRTPDGRLTFTGIFTANDLMAIGALRALKQARIAVPDQVEVIGFDDIEMAELMDPPLSTVSQPAIEMGRQSARMLLQMMTGKKLRQKTVTLNTRLVLRGTTLPVSEG